VGALLMYLVDTNILIYHFDDSIPAPAKDKLNSIFREHFTVSVITKMEFLGFRGHTSDSFEKADRFLSFAKVIGMEEVIVTKVIELRRSSAIKLPDAVIAATALTFNLILVTRNTDDFTGCGVSCFNPFDSLSGNEQSRS
jgi:predicted nucleic acid-binding protein